MQETENTFVFVEVKYRTTGVSGYPAEAVDARKQQTIAKCAMHFLMKQGNDDVPCRFDVVAIGRSLRVMEKSRILNDAFTTDVDHCSFWI